MTGAGWFDRDSGFTVRFGMVLWLVVVLSNVDHLTKWIEYLCDTSTSKVCVWFSQLGALRNGNHLTHDSSGVLSKAASLLCVCVCVCGSSWLDIMMVVHGCHHHHLPCMYSSVNYFLTQKQVRAGHTKGFNYRKSASTNFIRPMQT